MFRRWTQPPFQKTYRALEKALEQGLVASSVSVERGGLGVAVAKSALAGLLGCVFDLSAFASSGIERNDVLLFSESQGRILVSVDPDNQDKFEACFEGLPCTLAGEVMGNKRVIIKDIYGNAATRLYMDELKAAYSGVFKGF